MSVAAPALPLERTSLAIEELEADVQRDNDRRYQFYRMIRATDRVLGALEELNVVGTKVIPPALRPQLRRQLAGLPDECLAAYRSSGSVQKVLDSVFDVQDRLFLWRDQDAPPPDDDEMIDDPVLRDRIWDTIRAAPDGMTTFEIISRVAGNDSGPARWLLRRMATEGILRFTLEGRTGVRRRRRYFVAAAVDV